jgi:23S rRNA-/tRNA-specific pseudouridylate synthase
MFREKKIIKQYLAVTKFIPELSSGEIDIPLYRREVKNVTKTFLSPDYNENTKILMRSPKHDVDQRKNAITKYRVLDSADKAALLEVQPLTGKLEKKL